MREENRRNARQKSNIIRTKSISIIGFLVATILLTFAVYLAVRDEKTQSQAKLETRVNSTTISASSKIGKNINEVKESNNLFENGTGNSVISTSVENINDAETISENKNENQNENSQPTSENLESTSNKNTSSMKSETKESTKSRNTTSNSENSKSSENKVVATSTNASNTESTSSSNESSSKFIKPIDGETSKPFSMDSLIYSETLQEWTTHRGIDIKADKNTEVKATANGTVKSIKTDPRFGISVILTHKNGFESVYACLLNSAENLKEGDSVQQGQVIGNVGNSGVFETTDGMHLHFEILKDGEYVNPEIYLK